MTKAHRRGLLALAGLALASGSGFACLRQLTVMPGRSVVTSPPLTAKEAALAPTLEADVLYLSRTIGERNLGRTPDRLFKLRRKRHLQPTSKGVLPGLIHPIVLIRSIRIKA